MSEEATIRTVVRSLLVGGGLVLAFGLALAAWRVVRYLEAGQAISSTSGLVVFRVSEELVQYPPYVATTEAMIVGLGVVLLVVAVFVAALTKSSLTNAALTYSVSSSSRANTAGSNADAHTR